MCYWKAEAGDIKCKQNVKFTRATALQSRITGD
jgi:hypothetical protein